MTNNHFSYKYPFTALVVSMVTRMAKVLTEIIDKE